MEPVGEKGFICGKMPHVTAQMLVYGAEGGEMQFPVENALLQIGDLVLLEKGTLVPADTKILVGEIEIQPTPTSVENIFVKQGLIAPGGLRIVSGTAKGYVFALAENSFMAQK